MRRKLPWQPAGIAKVVPAEVTLAAGITKAVPAEVFQQNIPVLRSILLKSEAMAAVERKKKVMPI